MMCSHADDMLRNVRANNYIPNSNRTDKQPHSVRKSNPEETNVYFVSVDFDTQLFLYCCYTSVLSYVIVEQSL